MDDLLRDFLTETFENLDVVDQELVRFERNSKDKEALQKIFRLIHTVKGTCGFVGLTRLAALAHAAETLLGQFRDSGLEVSTQNVSLVLRTIDRIKAMLLTLERHGSEPEGSDEDLIAELERAAGQEARAEAAPIEGAGDTQRAADKEAAEDVSSATSESAVAGSSVRVNVELLERMMTLVSELVLTRNQLLQVARRETSGEFKVPLQRLSTITSDLQDSVMKARMQPIGTAWAKLPRLVRDLAGELGKKIELRMSGADTELDRQVMELFRDPLVHMIRNSADHGLETPQERRAAGKPEQGYISLSAKHEGGFIVVAIADDGRGIDPDSIRERVLRTGIASQSALDEMSEQQLLQFIFDSGFSTAETITNISGRGVGLDVVRTNIEHIGGSIDLRSKPGEGTCFTIKIPLTLTIVSALIVAVGQQRYAIPQGAVIELVRSKPGTECAVEIVHKTPLLRLRDRLLPLLRPDEIFRTNGTESVPLSSRESYVVVSQVGHQVFGIVVDQVFDTEEIVVKPVASILRNIQLFSGNTILGDGSVVMIVDPHGLARLVSAESGNESAGHQSAQPETLTDSNKMTLLIFRSGGEQQAVPLSLLTRLEEVDAGRFENCDGRRLLQYRGRLMPIVSMDERSPLRSDGRQSLLVVGDADRIAGLAVSEIVDIVHQELEIQLKARKDGTLGTAIINGRATEIIDVDHYLRMVGGDWIVSSLETTSRQMKEAAA